MSDRDVRTGASGMSLNPEHIGLQKDILVDGTNLKRP